LQKLFAVFTMQIVYAYSGTMGVEKDDAVFTMQIVYAYSFSLVEKYAS
jgi:hypothetical protein